MPTIIHKNHNGCGILISTLFFLIPSLLTTNNHAPSYTTFAFTPLSFVTKNTRTTTTQRPVSTTPPPFNPINDTTTTTAKHPPSTSLSHVTLTTLSNHLLALNSGSDVRGRFLDHPLPIQPSHLSLLLHHDDLSNPTLAPAFTPFAAYCIGRAFAQHLTSSSSSSEESITIVMGRDPRTHGRILLTAAARGAQSVANVRVVDTGIVTTPSLHSMCCSPHINLDDDADTTIQGAMMITASHLPADRNGIKFFTKEEGCFNGKALREVMTKGVAVTEELVEMEEMGREADIGEAPLEERVDYFSSYLQLISDIICESTAPYHDNCQLEPLEDLHIILNAGHGSGAQLYPLLSSLGANLTGSLGYTILSDDSNPFPLGIPNPESATMMTETKRACEVHNADIGLLLDTDADRSGFVLRNDRDGSYTIINGNRMIALLSQLLPPGETIVTDSVTSEGLSTFLTAKGCHHYRYVRGYANVIGKAREIDAAVAIETSGHCAFRDNEYSDDGTYTAVRVLGLLAQMNSQGRSLLDLIEDLEEMAEVREVRLTVTDGSLETTHMVFEGIEDKIRGLCGESGEYGWEIDEENQEGIRARIIGEKGSFFMMRRSLHDPVLSFYVEGSSLRQVQDKVVGPLLEMLRSDEVVRDNLCLQGLDDLASM